MYNKRCRFPQLTAPSLTSQRLNVYLVAGICGPILTQTLGTIRVRQTGGREVVLFQESFFLNPLGKVKIVLLKASNKVIN